MLAQVDEMLDREERERCCNALNKELRAIEDDIRFEFHESPKIQFCVFFIFMSSSGLTYWRHLC